MMAELYDINIRTINEHLKNIFSDGELDEISVIRKYRITATDGKNYNTNHYSLQAIIAVGFKVNNERAYAENGQNVLYSYGEYSIKPLYC